ncbi:hypothetical protein BH24ACT22_BH24ACT22_22060 [soil metagenome]
MPSARRPLATTSESTGFSVIAPMARMSAVVSVMMISITSVMETIGIIEKTGSPKWKGSVMLTHPASPTRARSAIPNIAAKAVPMTRPSRMAIRLRKPPRIPAVNRVMSKTTTNVKNANPILAGLPKSGASGTPPAAHRIATGISETPIIAMMVPVTTGGKNRNNLPKNGAAITVSRPATITDP